MALASKDRVPEYSSRLDVDLDILAENYRYVARRVGPAKVIAVAKANGLGHGLQAVAETLASAGATTVGVSNFLEGRLLREHGLKAPVLVMNGLTEVQMASAIRGDLSFFVFDEASIRLANDLGRTAHKQARVHIKVDTGLGRLGIMPKDAKAIASVVAGMDWLSVEGVASHLASPYLPEHDEFSRRQLALFLEASRVLDPEHKSLWHLAASSGALRFPEMYLDAVRVGSVLYGIGRVWPIPWPVSPVASYKSTIIQVKPLPAGHNIGYRLHYQAPQDLRIAVVPVGTTDTLTGEHADAGFVLIHGHRCRILGICSCEMMVDVTTLCDAGAGDEVVIVGKQGEDQISVVETATWGNTSYANFMTRLPARVPRLYWKGGTLVGVEVYGERS